MTDLLHDVDAPSDAELISRVRGGDVAAYGELFARHVDAARRLARQLVRGPDADDLVSDAFAKVLGVLQGGGGPDVAFRAYLLTSVRRLHVDRIRAGSRLQTSDDMEEFDSGVPFQDTAVAAFESGAAAKAFASLPERWQLVLWHLEVEGQKPADIAPLLGMSANSVSALAYRAREGLRQAFLTMHLNDTSDTTCRWVNEHLGAYVRNGLAKRDATKVQSHLDECRRCTAMYLELTEVNSNLRGIIAPLLLGAAAAGYLSSTGAAAGGGFGLMSMVGRARDVVTANAGAATAGAVAAGVAAVATAGIMLLPSSGPDDTVVGADEPIGAVTTPGIPDGELEPGQAGASDGAEDDEAAPEEELLEEDVTTPAEERALEPSPDAVPINSAGDVTGDGGTGDGTGGTGDGGTQPGTDQPGTDQPPAEEPGPNEPPAEAPPGEQPPGEQPPAPPGEEPPAPPGEEPPPPPPGGEEPPPGGEEPPPGGEEPPPPPGGEEPPPPGPVSLNVTVGGTATLAGNDITFEVSAGTDALPPTVEIDMTSAPDGITFGSSAACTPSSGTTVSCLTGSPVAELLSAPFMRALVSAEAVPLFVTAPLEIPADQPDTELTFTLRLPDGFEDPDPRDNVSRATYTAPVAPPTADVSLTGLKAVATGPHDYDVTGTLGKTDYDGGVALVISDATNRTIFGETPMDGCTIATETRLECEKLDAGLVALRLYVQDNRESETTVTITAVPLDGTVESDPDNNAAQVVLQQYRPEPVNAKVVVDQAPQGNSGKATVTVTVTTDTDTDTGTPVPLTLTGYFDPEFLDSDTTPLPASCTEVPSGLTCSAVDGATFSIPVDVGRVKNTTRFEEFRFTVSVPETFIDTNPGDDSDSELVERFGNDLVDNGGDTDEQTGDSSSTPTTDGLAPSAPTSPVARTLEATAKTLTSLAEDVTGKDRRDTSDREAASRSTQDSKRIKDAKAKATKSAKALKPTKDKAAKPAKAATSAAEKQPPTSRGPGRKHDQARGNDHRGGQDRGPANDAPAAGRPESGKTAGQPDTGRGASGSKPEGGRGAGNGVLDTVVRTVTNLF